MLFLWRYAWLLVAVDDSAAREVVGRELHDYSIGRENADVVLTHLPADVRENLVAVLQLHLEHGVRQCLENGALDFDGTVFLGQDPSHISVDFRRDMTPGNVDPVPGNVG